MNKNKFAPFNDDIENNPDRNYIAGEYSTFDIELSQLSKDKNISKIDLLKKANSKVSRHKTEKFFTYLRNKFEVAINKKETSEKLENFDSLLPTEKIYLGQQIIDFVTQDLNKDNNNIVRKTVLKSTRKIEFADFDAIKLEIRINLSARLSIFSGEILSRKVSFLEMLIHEYTHMIDRTVPKISALGAQTAHIAQKEYNTADKNHKTYEMNPLEINAYRNFSKFGQEK